MAAFTSTRAGNWSAVATWGGTGPPANGDKATVAAVGSAVSGAISGTGGVVRLTVASTASWTTGQYAYVAGVTGTTEANGLWVVTVVDGTHLELQGSAFANAYVSGGRANAVVSVDVNTTVGSSSSAIGRGVFVSGTSATQMGYLIVQPGVTLTAQGNDTNTNAAILIQQFAVFNPLSGSTISIGGPSDYGTQVYNQGILIASGVAFTSPSTSYSWANQVTTEVDSPTTFVFYDGPARLGNSGLAFAWIANNGGTGAGSKADSSFSFATGAGVAGMPAAQEATPTAITGAANNGSGLIRLTATGHGLTTGYYAVVASVGGVTNANGTWQVTVIDANTVDLQGSTFAGSYTAATGTIALGMCATEVTSASSRASDVAAAITQPGQYYLDYDCGVLFFRFKVNFSQTPTFRTNYKHLTISKGWGIAATLTQASNSLSFTNCTFQYMGSVSNGTSAVIQCNGKQGPVTTTQGLKVTGCTFTNCQHCISLAACTGTLADPVVITNNTFKQMNQSRAIGDPGGINSKATSNTYINVSGNTVNSRSAFIQAVTSAGNVCTQTGWTMANNSGVNDSFLYVLNPIGVTFPDSTISGNDFDGFGGQQTAPWVSSFGGTSGHPAVISGNRAWHLYQTITAAPYLTVDSNSFGASYDCYLQGPNFTCYCPGVKWTNNWVYGQCGPDDNPYGDENSSLCLGTQQPAWIDGPIVANNTCIGNPNGGFDFGNKAASWQGAITAAEVRNNLTAYDAQPFVTNNCGAQRGVNGTSGGAGINKAYLGATELDFNGFYSDGANYRNLTPGATFYMGGQKYHYNTRNVTGVALHTPGYATPPGALSLVYTITVQYQNETLAWGGGTAAQLVFDFNQTGGCTGAANVTTTSIAGLYTCTMTDSGKTWSTSLSSASCPVGYFVKFTTGTQAGNVFMVTSNTATVLTMVPGYTGVVPSAGDRYAIYYPEVTLADSGTSIQGWKIQYQGNGYTGTPTASLSGGAGTGAVAPTLTASGGSVATATGGGGGSGYTLASPPAVTVSGTGSGATVVAQLGQLQVGIDPRALPATSQTDTGITFVQHDVLTNPLVANSSGVTAADYKITAGSPDIWVGSTTNEVATDYFGNSRPVPPSIGFAEFVPSASMAATLGPDVFAGSATATASSSSGAMGVTLAADTFAGSGSFATSASMGVTLGADTFAGTATATGGAASGSMAVTLGADTFTGSASFTATASMAATLTADTFAGSATASGGASAGTMAVTLAADAFAGIGSGGGGTAFIAYVDPSAFTLIDTPSLDSGIDPTQVTIIQ